MRDYCPAPPLWPWPLPWPCPDGGGGGPRLRAASYSSRVILPSPLASNESKRSFNCSSVSFGGGGRLSFPWPSGGGGGGVACPLTNSSHVTTPSLFRSKR